MKLQRMRPRPGWVVLFSLLMLAITQRSNASRISEPPSVQDPAIAQQVLVMQPHLADSPHLETVASSQAWRRLLHYRRGLPFYRLRSDLDGSDFFFSPDGKTDPLAELRASALAFFRSDLKVGKLKQHPQCAFPERYRFVKQALALSIVDVQCQQFNEFLARFHHPKSVTLVFSNAYPDNPASMFGHTFLRINAGEAHPGGDKKLDLLDQGVSFAASVGTNENPLVFYWLGLTGGYPGAFTVIPYYAKVSEYNHAESRDLWEYDLTLNEEETLRLIRHLWEIETNSYFDYYFFDENCAFQLLTLLDVARPEWNMTPTKPWVIPGETVKIVTRTPGAVRDIKFRPSQRRQLVERYRLLSDSQKTEFFKLTRGTLEASAVSDVAVIDAATASGFYEKQNADGKLAPERQRILANALIRRSELGVVDEPALDTSRIWNTRPDLGHDATHFGLAQGITGLGSHSAGDGQRFFQELHWRCAFHDLMSNDLGFLRFSQIEFPSLNLRYYPSTSHLRVERMGLLSVLSLFPFTSLERKPSWGIDLSYESPKDYAPCAETLGCHTLRGRARAGLATQALSSDLLVYGLAVANLETGESLRKGYRVGPGVQLAALANPLPPYKVRLGYSLISDLFQDDRAPFFYQADLEHALSLGTQWDVRALWSVLRGYDEAKLTLNHYF